MITKGWKYASPELNNLWDWVDNNFAVTAVVPHCFQGVVGAFAGSAYDANTLYIALRMAFFFNANTLNITPGYVRIYDTGDIVYGAYQNAAIAYDSAGAVMKCLTQHIVINNIYFGRVQIGAYYATMEFNGYIITYA